jgi:eukaryotic-like serine/threonine-protein kinase
MSEVWFARDLELGRPVAVKILSGAGTSARFRREATSAASLSHPSIVAVFDYGEDAGRPYLVLEYLPGGTLDGLLARAGAEPMSAETASRIAEDVAAGLAHAHERRVVHRDLKPSNILFDAEGRAKIADFGIARMASDMGVTPPGSVLGTAPYMAPEQAAGEPVGPEADVYSFGIILFQMLTGRAPVDEDRPIDAALARHDAPPRLAALAASALIPDRRLRPADGRALLDGLEERTLAPARDAETTQTLVPVGTSGHRKRAGIALALLLVAVAGGAAGLLLTGETPDAPAVRDPADRARTPQTGPSGRGDPSSPAVTAEETGAATTREDATTERTTSTAPDTTAPATTETTPGSTETTPTTTATVPPTTTSP